MESYRPEFSFGDPALSKQESDLLMSDNRNFYGPKMDIDESFAKQSTPLHNFEIEHEDLNVTPRIS
jgi:hypothetical protein